MRIVTSQRVGNEWHSFDEWVLGTYLPEERDLMECHSKLIAQLRSANVYSVFCRYACFLTISIDELILVDQDSRALPLHCDQRTEIRGFFAALCSWVFPDWHPTGIHGQMKWQLKPDLLQMSYQENIQTELLPLLSP